MLIKRITRRARQYKFWEVSRMGKWGKGKGEAEREGKRKQEVKERGRMGRMRSKKGGLPYHNSSSRGRFVANVMFAIHPTMLKS